jgi:hypothetical protein
MDWALVREWVVLFTVLILVANQYRIMRRIDALGHLTVGILDAVDPEAVQTLSSDEFAELLLENDGLAWRKWDGSEE